MPTTIAAKEQNLDKVFSDEYFFEIPLYQRPYAWTTEQVGELLDDIAGAMESDSEAPYFLGSVVLIKGEGKSLSEVVDGQQRLTTLTMLFSVLRELTSGQLADNLDQFVREIGNELRGTKDRFRLSLRERDREFFEDHVQNRGKLKYFLEADPVTFSDSQKRIFENAKYLYGELTKRNGEQIKDIANYISKHCFLVVVSTSDGESAYRIFSVMNTRGLDLSPTDNLKALVIGKVPDDSKSKYTDQWEKTEVDLGRDSFRDLFAHIRTIYRKDKLRGSLQKEFQDYVLGDLTPEAAMTFVDDVLEPYADAYDIVSRATYQSTKDSEKVNALLLHLERLDNFDWIPPAMAYFLRNEGQTDSLIKFFRSFLTYLPVLLF